MKYKIGNEVLLKAVVVGCHEETNLLDLHLVTYGANEFICRMSENVIIAVPDMTAEEAWKISKKIFLDYSDSELDEIFGKGWSYPKLMEMTPQQAKSRIKAMESVIKIKVGDVVIRDGETGVVTNIDVETDFYTVLWKTGYTGEYHKKSLKNTGQHIDIDELLKQICDVKEVK